MLLARARDEVLPDVAIYRSQLINLFPDVGALPPSLAHRTAGVGTSEAEPLLQVVLGLRRASAQLAASLEPREHGVAMWAVRLLGLLWAVRRLLRVLTA